MNRIFKVIWSKTKHCYVVVSELAKNQRKCHSVNVKGKTALAAAVLLALTSFSFVGAPTAQAANSVKNNDYVGANSTYWYWDKKTNTWKTYDYKLGNAFNNRSFQDLPNYNGAGAKLPGAITAGLYAQAGQQTITIGDRNAGQSRGSVFIGEHSGYNNGDNVPSESSSKNNYVTAVGFQSGATGWGSIAIGSNAVAENTMKTDTTVNEVGEIGNPKTVSDDVYGIESNPAIEGASVALGYNAHAKDGNIAIGAYSEATDTSSATPYVSVGNTTIKRRITNVADGTNPSDVATFGQLQDLSAKVGVYDAGFGIKIDSDKNEKKNTISVKHNLSSGNSAYADTDATGLILGGSMKNRNAAKQHGAATASSVIVGAQNALASNENSVVIGGLDNVASGANSTVVGGDNNKASGNQSAVFGGRDNTASGIASAAGGGILNVASGQQATAIGGFSNYALGTGSTSVGGYGKDYEIGYNSSVNGSYSVGIAGGSTGTKANYSLAAGRQAVVTTENGTAIGYQATTDEANTIAFGHDKGDVSGYTVTWEQLPNGQTNADGTSNDYTKAPTVKVKKTTYDSAAYNRLVKVADGVEDHDVVVMEQLKNASDVGSNIKVYKTDENGNVQFDENNKPIEDKSDAAKTKQKDSKDAWGKALGAGTFTTGTDTTPTNASTSDQLVTGKTLYDYDKPTGSQNYVNVNSTTGQNLSALDTQVKANADTLNDSTHNIKYYSVNGENLPGFGQADTFSNAGNKGAAGRGSLAAGAYTYTAGLASTVAGSYSGIYNIGTVSGTDFRGAAALSLGTVNINRNTDTTKPYSGVANSLIGQANMTADSNAAIILGAGNTVKDSYRDISNFDMSGDMEDALKKAVPESGGQVMVMGGGNSVEKAYMTQVTGVGNTVTGSGDAYDKDKSSQLNYVEGFYTTLTNGKNDYLIGAHNNVTGDSTDKNQSNIVFGDNHTLTNTKNNIILGSADKGDTTTVSDVVSMGHNAKVSAEGGVAIGSGSEATTAAGVAGYDPATGVASTTETAFWKATNGAVSVGKADGSVTRQINGLAAGTKDTDAVNVAQLKKLGEAVQSNTEKGLAGKANVDASNIGTNLAADKQQENLKNWGKAIGTGKVEADNGQLVTGETVYDALHGGLTDITIGKDGKDGQAGSIGLVGPKGKDGKDGLTTTIIKTETGDAGVDGKDGITRIVYGDKDDPDHKHTVATLEDGLKFKGDDGKEIAKKLNDTLEIVGGVTDSTKLTDNNIGVTNADGKLKIQLANELTGITSIGNQNTTGEGAKITLGTDGKTTISGGDVNVSGNKVTNLGQGSVTKDSKDAVRGDQLYTEQKAREDADKAINDKIGSLTDNGNYIQKGNTISQNLSTLDTHVKQNADNITNIRQSVSDLDKNAVKYDGDAKDRISLQGEDGTIITNVKNGALNKDSTDAVNGGQLYTEQKAREDADKAINDKIGSLTDNGNYIQKGDTISQNLSTLDTHVKQNADAISQETKDREAADKAINDKIGSLDKNGNYIQKDVTISNNLSTLDTHVKQNEEKITTIKNTVDSLDQNAVKYDDSSKGQITLGGQDGTKITKVKDGEMKENSKDAVNGGQLFEVDQKVTNNTTEINKIKNGDFTDASRKAIHNIAKDAVEVVDGTNTKVVKTEGTDTTPTQYQVNVEGKGTVASGDTGLISGDTAYTELRPADGTYVKRSSTTAANLSALDTGLKNTSSLIHTNTSGDTIHIGETSKATKVDVSSTDANGNKNGRVVTGVVTDTSDANSAANVGYVNGVAEANTRQLYRDMDSAYSRLDNNINRAAAGANALAALHPLDYDPDDKLNFAAGFGHYHNANAAAVGAFYYPNERTMINVGFTMGNGDPGVNAGVSFRLGKGSIYNGVSKAAMAQTIHDQSVEIDNLKKENQEMKQQIQEILKKLNG